MGCREQKAKAWAIRCQLEMQDHGKAAFSTLTYTPKKRPVTLQKRHLQLFLKRLRKTLARQKPTRHIRFFAAGEYGERTKLPHYHAIIYGASTDDKETIQKAWGMGHVDTANATPASIAYVAGYSAKKYGENREAQTERVDPETGEVYTYQPPFLQMSRRPGIGATAKKKYRDSWRSFAIMNGVKYPVPRYFHEHWKDTATDKEKEHLENEKHELMKIIRQTPQQREAQAEIAKQKHRLKAAKRQKI